MRDFKCKAWDRINKRWLNLFIIELNGDGIPLAVRDINDELYGLHQVELVWYTGLHDKQGKEIYEGDIVQNTLFGLAVIEYNDQCMRFQANSSQEGMAGIVITANMSRNEVIGNIWENKELLNAT